MFVRHDIVAKSTQTNFERKKQQQISFNKKKKKLKKIVQDRLFLFYLRKKQFALALTAFIHDKHQNTSNEMKTHGKMKIKQKNEEETKRSFLGFIVGLRRVEESSLKFYQFPMSK